MIFTGIRALLLFYALGDECYLPSPVSRQCPRVSLKRMRGHHGVNGDEENNFLKNIYFPELLLRHFTV